MIDEAVCSGSAWYCLKRHALLSAHLYLSSCHQRLDFFDFFILLTYLSYLSSPSSRYLVVSSSVSAIPSLLTQTRCRGSPCDDHHGLESDLSIPVRQMGSLA